MLPTISAEPVMRSATTAMLAVPKFLSHLPLLLDFQMRRTLTVPMTDSSPTPTLPVVPTTTVREIRYNIYTDQYLA